MKKFYLKSKAAARAALLMLTAFFASPAAAQTTTQVDVDPNSPYTGKTYQYKQDDGTLQTASYLTKAADKNQILGLLGSIVTDQTIPGQRSTLDNDGNPANSFYKVVWKMEESNSSASSNWETFDVRNDYAPHFWQNYKNYIPYFTDDAGAPLTDNILTDFTTQSTTGTKKYLKRYYWDVTPENDGKTVLLVEVVDDYKRPSSIPSGLDDFEETSNYIKAVSVMPLSHQMRIENTDDSNLSGTLVNINANLNKFFVLIKGDISMRSGYNKATRKMYYHPPFYWYFEQLAPVGDSGTTDYVNNALASMTGGSTFAVKHNCGAIFHNGHPIYMKTEENTEGTQVNMLLFIPDGRFVGSNSVNEPYNKYNNYYYKTSGKDYRPYFFINTIELTSTLNNNIDEENHVAVVAQEWTSSLRNVLKNNQYETFYIERSYDGGVTWSIVPEGDIKYDGEEVVWITDDAFTGKLEDGTPAKLMRRENNATTNITVAEKQQHKDRDVMYRVYGRIYQEGLTGKDFDFVLSNETTVTIPGYDPFTNPDLAIELIHSSKFDVDKQRNEYVNTVNFLVRGEAAIDKALRATHIAADTKFQLRRYNILNTSFDDERFSNGEGDEGQLLATYVVKSVKKYDSDAQTSTEIVLECTEALNPDMQGKTITLVDTDYNGETELTLAGKTGAGEAWGTYVDKITYDVAVEGHADGTLYTYRLFGENVKNFMSIKNGVETEVTSGQLSSNLPVKRMPRLDHGVNMPTYTLAQIQNDKDGQLAESTPRLIFTPQVAGREGLSCEIVDTDNNKCADVTFTTATNYWTLTSTDGSTDHTILINDPIEVTAARDAMGKEVVMIITDGENTYGTPRHVVPSIPQAEIVFTNMIKDQEPITEKYTVCGSLKVTHDAQAKEQYLSHGYGMWHKREIQSANFAPADPNLYCTELRHHKYETEAEKVADFTFNYGKEGVTEHVGKSLVKEPVNAVFEDVVPAMNLTSQKLYFVWYRASYYAQYTEKVDEISGASLANEEPRYVVVKTSAGMSHDGLNPTGLENVSTDDSFTVHGGEGEAVLNGNCQVEIFNMQGVVMYNHHIEGETVVYLPAGLYVANGHKFIVH